MKAKDFANELLEKTNWPDDEMCPPPLEAQEGLNTLINHFLGKDWCVTLPIGQKQVNSEAVYQILKLYPERQTFKEWLKKFFRT